jgi:hypothetical protein
MAASPRNTRRNTFITSRELDSPRPLVDQRTRIVEGIVFGLVW